MTDPTKDLIQRLVVVGISDLDEGGRLSGEVGEGCVDDEVDGVSQPSVPRLRGFKNVVSRAIEGCRYLLVVEGVRHDRNLEPTTDVRGILEREAGLRQAKLERRAAVTLSASRDASNEMYAAALRGRARGLREGIDAIASLRKSLRPEATQ